MTLYLLDTDALIYLLKQNPGVEAKAKHIGRFAIISLHAGIADTFGEIKTDLRRQGQILADFDLLIGATAIATGRTLVTNNTRHFQRLSTSGLTLDNWKS